MTQMSHCSRCGQAVYADSEAAKLRWKTASGSDSCGLYGPSSPPAPHASNNVIHPVVRLIWKDEGEAGPLWIVSKDGSRSNYRDSEYENGRGGFLAEWYSFRTARQIARNLNVPLETV